MKYRNLTNLSVSDDKTKAALKGYLMALANEQTRIVEAKLAEVRAAIERDDLKGAYANMKTAAHSLLGISAAIDHAVEVTGTNVHEEEEFVMKGEMLKEASY